MSAGPVELSIEYIFCEQNALAGKPIVNSATERVVCCLKLCRLIYSVSEVSHARNT